MSDFTYTNGRGLMGHCFGPKITNMTEVAAGDTLIQVSHQFEAINVIVLCPPGDTPTRGYAWRYFNEVNEEGFVHDFAFVPNASEEYFVANLNIVCPHCQGANLSSRQKATKGWRVYRAYSDISWFDADGTINYSGSTNYDAVPGDWNDYDLTLKTSAKGYPRLSCNCCGHEWFEPRVKEEEC